VTASGTETRDPGDVYRYDGLDTGSIVAAGLDLVD
jgi:hypothetical protein